MARILAGVLAGLVSMLFPQAGFGDQWRIPRASEVYSSSGKYRFTTIPGSSSFAESLPKGCPDRVQGGQAARGRLERTSVGGGYELVWERSLCNASAPVGVVVGDRGRFVATLDDWGMMGYGDNLLVIYGEGGRLIRRLKLGEIITLEEVGRLYQTISSRYWRRNQYFDSSEEHIVIEVVAREHPRCRDDHRFRPVRIRLLDGKVQPSASIQEAVDCRGYQDVK